MAVLIAALVSTIDSALNSLSTVFTLDIYVRRFKPKATQKEIITIGRITMVAGSVLGVGVAMSLSLIQGSDLFTLFQSILGFLAPPMSAVFLMGILWKRVTPAAANLTLSLGSLISIGIGVCSLTGFPSKAFWPHSLLLSFFIFVGLLVLMIVVTLFTSRDYAGSPLPRLKDENTDAVSESKSVVWAFWGVLATVMTILYIVFN